MASAPGPLLYLDHSVTPGTTPVTARGLTYPVAFQVVSLVVSILALVIATWALVTRRKITGVAVRPDHPVETVLTELLEKSRASGGRVHIHDVEESLRRVFG